MPFEYDETMYQRGEAIRALGLFRDFADEVVPVLIDAFEAFEEYDPDYTYHGMHERVCDAIRELGPAAKATVPRLIEYLQEFRASDESWASPRDVLLTLKALGPAASEALPVLEDWAAEDRREGYDPPDDLREAIAAIRD